MGFAFCLRFDPDTTRAVTAVWQALADGGAGDGMLRLGYPPHLSLAVLDDEPSTAVMAAALDAVGDLAELSVKLGGVRRFPDTPIVWLAVDGGRALGQLHQRLLDRLPEMAVREHYRAGQWTPHVTLQTEGEAVQAMDIAEHEWPAPLDARVVALDLVQFPPVTVVRTIGFASNEP